MNPLNHSRRGTSFGSASLGLVILLSMATTASSATYTWSGGGSPDPAMTNAANWVGGVAPPFFSYSQFSPDDILFTGSLNASPIVPDQVLAQPPRIGGITFDGAASAFTIGPADADHYLYLGIDGQTTNTPIVNNSAETQTLGAVAMHSGTVNAANGDLIFNHAFNVGGGSVDTGYAVALVGDNSIVFNGGLVGAGTSSSGGGSLSVDMREQQPDTTYTYGRVYITADSMVPGDLLPSPWAGKVTVRYGSLRISSNNALGDPNTKTVVSDQGTLELAGDITVPENIQFNGKSGSEPIVRNVSGNNTMTGLFTGATGGGNYYFRSDAGKVTINSDLICPGTGTRRFHLYGEGEGEIKGNIGNNGDRVWTYFRKYDSGTWTLSGANTYTKTTEIYDGTIALAGAGTINESPGVRLSAATSKFDVSGLTSGSYILGATKSQYIDGIGVVVGNVNVAGGSTVRAGVSAVGLLTFDGDLTFQDGAFKNWQLGGLKDDTTGVGGTDFDQFVLKNGDLDLGTGAVLRVYIDKLAAELKPTADPLDVFWKSSHTWKIIDVDIDNGGTNSGNTDFASILFPETAGTPTDVAFDTYVGRGVDLGDIFLTCTPTNLPPIPGDATRNGIVDADDAALLAQHWGETGDHIGWDQGDFNEDHVVNAADASILAANWGGHAESSGVPEPSFGVLLLSMLVGAFARRGRQADR